MVMHASQCLPIIVRLKTSVEDAQIASLLACLAPFFDRINAFGIKGPLYGQHVAWAVRSSADMSTSFRGMY